MKNLSIVAMLCVLTVNCSKKDYHAAQPKSHNHVEEQQMDRGAPYNGWRNWHTWNMYNYIANNEKHYHGARRQNTVEDLRHYCQKLGINDGINHNFVAWNELHDSLHQK